MARRRHRVRILIAGSWMALSLLLMSTIGRAIETVDHAAPSHPPAKKAQIGRIFFSPAERRSRNPGQIAASAVSNNRGTASNEGFAVNGAISSSTHGRAVWVNGVAIENSAANKSAWTDRNGNVWLNAGTLGIHLIRPGQSIDRSGAMRDLLPPGSVARR